MSTGERLKLASEGLFYVHSTHESRHTMRSEIDALSARQAETITEHAKEIAKHFGIYKQRERNESGKKDGDFIFMVRVKNPAGGELTPAQWLALDAVADRYADGSLRLTARQGVQFHYVRGHNLRSIIRAINATCQRQRLPTHDAGRMRRRESQYCCEPDRRSGRRVAARFARAGACGGARDGAAEFGVLPGFPRRSEWTAGRAVEFGRAGLRRAISAAQVQGRLCASA